MYQKNQNRKGNKISHLYSKFFKKDLAKEHYLFLQPFSFTYPKSKEQVNCPHNQVKIKTNPALPVCQSPPVKLRLCCTHTQPRAHRHTCFKAQSCFTPNTYPFPGMFEELHLSFQLSNLIQVPPPGATDMTCICVTAIPVNSSNWPIADSFYLKTHSLLSHTYLDNNQNNVT